MAAPPTRLERWSAVVLAVGLLVVAGFQVYWTFGVWGLDAASGGELHLTVAVRIASGVVAVALVAAAAGVLGRVGYWGNHVRFSVFRWGTWVTAVLLLLGAVNNLMASTGWQRFDGLIALVLALLAFVVARSGRESRHHWHFPHRTAHTARPTRKHA